MDILGGFLIISAGILMISSIIAFYIAAFREHILWGLGCILIPPVNLFFLIIHWDKGGQPFLFHIAGCVTLVAGLVTHVPFDT